MIGELRLYGINALEFFEAFFIILNTHALFLWLLHLRSLETAWKKWFL